MNVSDLRPYVVTETENVTVKTLVSIKNARFVVKNNSDGDAVIREVVLLDAPLLKPTMPFYAESYNMLAQYKGTVAEPRCIGEYPDATHYKLPTKEGFFTAYNYAAFRTAENRWECVGFTSCNRFSGEIRFSPSGRLQIAVCTENKVLPAGQSLQLEELMFTAGTTRSEAIREFLARTAHNHRPLECASVPTGWCSWYCFGPNVTEKNVIDNMEAAERLGLPLRYIQIDDGYEAAMGDWLLTASSFHNNIQELITRIRRQGFEPAIWVAPFIAEKNSRVFTEHPDWFVMDENGTPLSSGDVSFGGWSAPPWYMLDPTHPDAYAYLKTVFSTMRRRWHVKYFKMDANMWGALPFGVRHDRDKTSVEAYRLGMKAILEGAGEDSFLLGCNAPMWPSLGLVHGMRITGDISRKWEVFKRLKEECLSRNLYHNCLWINDPDCLTAENLTEDLVGGGGEREGSRVTTVTDEEFLFHATYLLASGGMILSGDDLSAPELKNLEILRKLLNQKRIAAEFDDALEIGSYEDRGSKKYFLLNEGETEKTYVIPAERYGYVTELWSGKNMPVGENNAVEITLPPHSGRVLVFMQMD
ncbi:MAG: alpha-galactosidase [Eubacteriales bacterium]|nr:alpha-galactosidase [Eubacteriales bacterium]